MLQEGVREEYSNLIKNKQAYKTVETSLLLFLKENISEEVSNSYKNFLEKNLKFGDLTEEHLKNIFHMIYYG